MKQLDDLKKAFEKYLFQQIPDKEPRYLYQPLRYILQNGGKRIRPLLVLLATQSFGKYFEESLGGAASIEIFHNFTLIHDDIMDKAEIRRGKPSVHTKWNENTAILSGDTMMILAYKMLEIYPEPVFKQLVTLLNQTALEVCEGQQMDMDFEQRNDVTINQYLEMIRLKTAVLLGTALKFGAIIAQTDENNRKNIAQFGIHIGMAFQIQDDYLDVYADAGKFGKKTGGDIIDKKKTFLYLSALEKAKAADRERLIELYNSNQVDTEKLIQQVVQIFDAYKVAESAQQKINFYTRKSMDYLHKLDITEKEKKMWQKFAYDLMHRIH